VNTTSEIKKIVVCEFDATTHWGFFCRLVYYPTSSVALLTEFGTGPEIGRLDLFKHVCDYLLQNHKLSYGSTIWIERVSARPEDLITNDDSFNLVRVHDKDSSMHVSGWRALSWEEVESVVQPVWPELFSSGSRIKN